MLIKLSGLILGFVLVVSGASNTYAEQPKDAVLALLQGYEWQLPEAQLYALPAASYEQLIAIAEDPVVLPFVQARAVESLALYQNEVVWQFMQARLAASKNGQQRRTLETICHRFIAADKPETSSESFAADLIPMLQDDNANLRTIAANCLSKINKIRPNKNVVSAMGRYEANIKQAWERKAAGFVEPGF